jgi:glycosyltransferase involved in cell wall biosynthesis
LLQSDRVLTVVKEARDRVLREHKTLLDKNVINIENFESKRFIIQQTDARPSFKKDHFSILYIGGFGPHRGVDTLIKAMAIVKKSNCNIRVQLIGARPSDYLNTLTALVSELGVEEQVKITGWVAADQVLANIQQADVCCVPHHSNHHTDNTVPHKLYQYMIAKKPLLVSTSAPLRRIVTQANAGYVFKSSDPLDCAKVIMEMYKKHNDLEQFARNGFLYVMENSHNWEEKSAPALISMYDNLLKVDGVE